MSWFFESSKKLHSTWKTVWNPHFTQEHVNDIMCIYIYIHTYLYMYDYLKNDIWNNKNEEWTLKHILAKNMPKHVLVGEDIPRHVVEELDEWPSDQQSTDGMWTQHTGRSKPWDLGTLGPQNWFRPRSPFLSMLASHTRTRTRDSGELIPKVVPVLYIIPLV